MRRRLLIFVFLTLLCGSGTAFADGFHPSRARLLIHGRQELKQGRTALQYHFIPAPNLSAGISPLAYTGFEVKPVRWLALEPALGYNFSAEEPVFSLRVTPKIGRFWSWTDLEYRRPSGCGYWFSQAEIKVRDWFHTGIEGEGWGVIGDSGSWTYGAGPDILLRFGKLGADIALHARYLDGRTAPEFFLRTHLFL